MVIRKNLFLDTQQDLFNFEKSRKVTFKKSVWHQNLMSITYYNYCKFILKCNNKMIKKSKQLNGGKKTMQETNQKKI